MELNIISQLLLIVGSIGTFIFIIRITVQRDMRIDMAVPWIILIFILIVFSVFPKLAFYLTNFLGFEVTSNLMFLLVIFYLIIMIFLLYSKVSHVIEKNKDITHELTLVKKEIEEMRGTQND